MTVQFGAVIPLLFSNPKYSEEKKDRLKAQMEELSSHLPYDVDDTFYLSIPRFITEAKDVNDIETLSELEAFQDTLEFILTDDDQYSASDRFASLDGEDDEVIDEYELYAVTLGIYQDIIKPKLDKARLLRVPDAFFAEATANYWSARADNRPVYDERLSNLQGFQYRA